MEKPQFVILTASCLVKDLIFLVCLPFFGPTAVLGLVLWTPLLMIAGSGDALDWLQSQGAQESRLSALSRAICGSSFLFLLLCVAALLWPEPGAENLWGLLAFFYLNVVIFRLLGSGFLNIFPAAYCALKGQALLVRLNGVSALLTSLAGLYLFKKLFLENEPTVFRLLTTEIGLQNEATGYAFLALYLVVGFVQGLVWGGVVQWLAVQWKK